MESNGRITAKRALLCDINFSSRGALVLSTSSSAGETNLEDFFIMRGNSLRSSRPANR